MDSPSGLMRIIGRVVLGAVLVLAGIAHLTFSRQEFLAQVPGWMPIDPDLVVLASGVVEIALGIALWWAPAATRPVVGLIVAIFFVVIFPGNIAQFVEGKDGFGLDTDQARLVRLFFQPVLVVWALWAGGTWAWWRARRT